MHSASTFLMFTGEARAALALYGSLFDSFTVEALEPYGADEGERADWIRRADIRFAGQRLIFIDSPPVHDFTFTPSISIFVDCPSADEVDRLYNALAEGGMVMMPLDQYDFATRFAWVADRFGVSWQLCFVEKPA